MRKIDTYDTLDERMKVARKVLRSENPTGVLDHAVSLDGFNVNLLYGYVRSFVTLAMVGDVNVVAEQLNTTRQSVSRHILELENLLDARLFECVGKVSSLAEYGVLWLPRAQELFDVAGAFLRRKGMNAARYQSTQLPLRMLLRDEANSDLLRRFAKAWMQSDQVLGGDWMAGLREFGVLYGRSSGVWVSVEIGEQSSFYRWFGAELAQQSVGRPLGKMQTGQELQDEIRFILDGVYTRGGLHFSEVACQLKRPETGERENVLYQRLLAEIVDEQGSPLIVSVIDLINHHQTGPVFD